MRDYSENWRHLRSILAGYATRDRGLTELFSYEDHTHAKALSIFLAHAKLATPKLDRETVEAVLAGKQSWPQTSGAPFAGSDIPLSLLEEYGLVAFYAGWCTTHCDKVEDPAAVDPSLMPLVQAVEYLKDIRFGRNGCIQPYYACPADELKGLLTAEFGEYLTVGQLLPELSFEAGVFRLPPGNERFSSLISTYLWQALRRTLSPEETFSEWIMRFRVNCDWAMPVHFESMEYPERKAFNEQLVNFLAKDAALGSDFKAFVRQSINQDGFSSVIRPMKLHLSSSVDADGNRSSSHHNEELPKLTLSSLETAYPHLKAHASSNLEFVIDRTGLRVRRQANLFYSWLINSAIDASIRVDGQQLMSTGLAEALVELSNSRPILKYVLFILLPEYEVSNYLLLLLARPATCEVAFYYLAKHTFAFSRGGHAAYIQSLENGYQQLVCHEYIRSIEKEPDFNARLLDVIGFLGDHCNMQSSDFSKSFEYRFLINLLGALNHQQVIQVGQAFAELSVEMVEPAHSPTAQHHRYLLGFWLINRLESTGIDPSGAVCRALRTSILEYYKVEFSANLKGQRSLEASSFFATLPWYKLIAETGPNPLLSLSNTCSSWQQELVYTSQAPFVVASAIRHYLQVLMNLGRPTASSQGLHAVAARVLEIVRLYGFGPREKFVLLFGDSIVSDKYDLWEQFCTYLNIFRDELYAEFVQRCIPSIPLDHLFVLLENCAVIARAQQLQEAIEIRQSAAKEDLGLTGLEQAFISACDAGLSEAASRLLDSAKAFLAQDRFANTSNPLIVRARKVWRSYEYKWQLLELGLVHKSDADSFQKAAHEVPIPHEWRGANPQSDDRTHYQECERFRRQIVASAYSEIEPHKCIRIMEALYRETKHVHHGYLLFYGHYKLHATDKDSTRLKHALTYFLGSLVETEPQQMREYWIATILESYRLTSAPEIDTFWSRLTPEQQSRTKILNPYCRALIARGETSAARKIIGRYRDLNPLTPEELGVDSLLDELARAEPDCPPMSDLIQLMNECSQRSNVQLRKHYCQIMSKDFEDYVGIVRPDQPSHVYLKDAVLEVAGEIVLRKKNLQVQSISKKVTVNSRITKEDLINDWFTSLFDKRMAEARIGFRDQKRGGQSASGAGPGEIDGFITAGDNTRIAIFEAFRLFSLDTTVIFDHLNKVAGYDHESLSPVFIAAYCDVSDFSGLVSKYRQLVSKQDYAGYNVAVSSPDEVESLHDTDHIWLGTETRRRDRRDVIFYHLLLNLHVPPVPISSADGA
ncbi:hypothetical protein UIA24_19705 [Pseudomonas sp. AL 58]|uniref:hypothetical protein n=1 Tax=Pseudomonas sp. AL 58 TaxID=3104275 RepID=UPI002EA10C15|nr:hypothetical protein [Pseudomonas sp. AL 58]